MNTKDLITIEQEAIEWLASFSMFSEPTEEPQPNFVRPSDNIMELVRLCGSLNKSIAIDAQQTICDAFDIKEAIYEASDFEKLTKEQDIKSLVPHKYSTWLGGELKYCREARWDIVQRTIQVLETNVLVFCKAQSTKSYLEKVFISPVKDAHGQGRMELEVTLHYYTERLY